MEEGPPGWNQELSIENSEPSCQKIASGQPHSPGVCRVSYSFRIRCDCRESAKSGANEKIEDLITILPRLSDRLNPAHGSSIRPQR